MVEILLDYTLHEGVAFSKDNSAAPRADHEFQIQEIKKRSRRLRLEGVSLAGLVQFDNVSSDFFSISNFNVA